MNDTDYPNKRRRSRSPPWRKQDSARQYRDRDSAGRRDNAPPQKWSHKDQMRINQMQEDERMREWVAQEDDFVLKQAKKKADIRVKEGRAKPIDWLAVTLRVVDPTRNPLDDEVDEADLDFVDPDSVFDGLSESDLSELRKDIETYMNLEKNKKNRDYWRTMQIICKDRLKKLRVSGPEGRAVSSVASDIDRLLGPKSYEQLETLEGQIRTKLDSDEPIDTDYWQQLLDSLLVWKAKAKLKKVYQDVLDSRLRSLREENERRADAARQVMSDAGGQSADPSGALDPDPLLEIPAKDKSLEILDESQFLQGVAAARRKVLHMGYVPAPKANSAAPTIPSLTQSRPSASQSSRTSDPTSRFDHSSSLDDHSSTTKALFDRDVARGIGENEEVFAGEEEEESTAASHEPAWIQQYGGKYRPRKPKYFNRVQMGYEWNKYNQTHYDHDNPPPKVVQGYKFHIFYPDLIDPSRAPTYKIIREGGRKKGQKMAPAGEEDTCIIRFMSGPPYEDIAFRIVDRDWDYSAKHDRGFKSTFEKGVLTLHFSFKRVIYRK